MRGGGAEHSSPFLLGEHEGTPSLALHGARKGVMRGAGGNIGGMPAALYEVTPTGNKDVELLLEYAMLPRA